MTVPEARSRMQELARVHHRPLVRTMALFVEASPKPRMQYKKHFLRCGWKRRGVKR